MSKGALMQKLKEIISTFIKVDPKDITPETVIDRSVIPGSIMIHRMYSALAKEGFVIKNSEGIRTFADLLDRLNQKEKVVKEVSTPNSNGIVDAASSKMSVGIDIEDIDNFPTVSDYREDRFYQDNFSQKEISYCILQADPKASFAGRFALKEAIVKADNSYKNIPFNKIEILNDKDGKPLFKGFSVSLSHASNQAVAVAAKEGEISTIKSDIQKQNITFKKSIKDEIEDIKKEVEEYKKQNSYLIIFMVILLLIIIILFFKG